MKINKLGFLLCVLTFLCLATFSTGFDLYAHSVIYYKFEYPISHTYLLFEEIVMPRYLLLSYIYEITRRLGIPIGVVAFILVAFPTYNLALYISQNSRKNSLQISNIFILGSILLLTLLYSGLSLVLLWIIALLTTRKKVFLLGILFHPLGLILGLMSSLVFREYLKTYIYIVFIFFMSLYLLSSQAYFTSSIPVNIKYKVTLDKDEISKLFSTAFDSKANEFYGIFIILTFSYFAQTKLKAIFSYLKNLKIPKVIVLSIFFFTIFASNIYFIFNNRHSLIIDTISFNISDPVYITWYDWGSRDINESKESLNYKRYE